MTEEKKRARAILETFIDWYAPDLKSNAKLKKELEVLITEEEKGTRRTIVNIPHCLAE